MKYLLWLLLAGTALAQPDTIPYGWVDRLFPPTDGSATQAWDFELYSGMFPGFFEPCPSVTDAFTYGFCGESNSTPTVAVSYTFKEAQITVSYTGTRGRTRVRTLDEYCSNVSFPAKGTLTVTSSDGVLTYPLKAHYSQNFCNVDGDSWWGAGDLIVESP